MRKRRILSLCSVIAILMLVPFHFLRANMTFTADDTYLKGAVTVYLPDKENEYALEMSGPGGTFNKGNSGSCYIEGDGKITINYGYMEKGRSYSLKVTSSDGSEIGQFTFVIKSKTSGSFLVSPPDNAATPTPIPSPTPEPTREPEATPTPVPPVVINTPTNTPKPTKTTDPTSTPTSQPTPTPTETPVPTDTPTPEPTPSDTPIPTDIPTLIPTEEPIANIEPTKTPTESTTTETTEPEPSETEPQKEEKKTVIDHIEDVAVNIPGIYQNPETKTVRVKWNVAVASLVVAFLLGFCIMFVVRLAKESKRISTEAFFKGTLSRTDTDSDTESEENP